MKPSTNTVDSRLHTTLYRLASLRHVFTILIHHRQRHFFEGINIFVKNGSDDISNTRLQWEIHGSLSVGVSGSQIRHQVDL